MCIFLYSFCFSTNYKCNYGEFLAILGNTEEFGAWDPAKAIEMQWSENNNWRKYVSLKQNNDTILQYKYLVCCRNGPNIKIVRWEEGPNRCLNLLQLTNLSISVDDIWESRKISIFLKDNTYSLSSLYIIGNDEHLGNMIEAQEMKKISFLCPFEKVLQTYWYKQIIVSSKSLMSKLVFNYLAFYSESKEFEFIGNETSAKIRFVWDNSAKDSQNIKLYHTNDLKEFNSKIKIKKSSLKSSFDSNYFSRIQRNELQIFQDRYLIENNRQIFKINEFLHAGSLSKETLKNATLENIKRIVLFTNLKRIKLGSQTYHCIDRKECIAKNIIVDIVDLSEDKEINLKKCALAMEGSMKQCNNTLICWGNSKRQSFKTLIEYMCNYKKFSEEAAKKYLKISGSRAQAKRSPHKYRTISR